MVVRGQLARTSSAGHLNDRLGGKLLYLLRQLSLTKLASNSNPPASASPALGLWASSYDQLGLSGLLSGC